MSRLLRNVLLINPQQFNILIESLHLYLDHDINYNRSEEILQFEVVN